MMKWFFALLIFLGMTGTAFANVAERGAAKGLLVQVDGNGQRQVYQSNEAYQVKTQQQAQQIVQQFAQRQSGQEKQQSQKPIEQGEKPFVQKGGTDDVDCCYYVPYTYYAPYNFYYTYYYYNTPYTYYPTYSYYYTPNGYTYFFYSWRP